MDSSPAWRLERDEAQIAWITADKPGTGTNVLSAGVLTELDGLLRELESRPARGLVILSAKKSGFIAGADIKEFTSLTSAESGYQLIRSGQRVLDRLAALRCPTVAALHGFALGGGLELALACRYRVAVADERLRLGLPEVQLGIHPGFGGTVRSVRRIGVRAAMQLMLTGKPVRAEKALRLGLVDRLVPEGALREAARELVLAPPPPGRAPLPDRVLALAPARALVARSLRRQVAARAPQSHYPAPYAVIELWRRYGARGEAAYEAEARSIAALFTTPTAQNLIRVFMLQDRLKGLAGRGQREFRHVHVVGAGVMGGDIAAWAALRGLTVTLQDTSAQSVERAIGRAGELFGKRLRAATEREAARARLRADSEGAGVREADVVIEAIFEDLAAKRTLHARLEPQLKAGALLATNTSSLTLEPLAAGLSRPERLVGLHFFNPVPQMPLVEIVHAQHTDPQVLQDALLFARRLDKLPVPCRSAPGFIVNRVLMPYLHEAMHAAQEGIPLERIDATAVAFGMPVGPVELADVVGLDVASHVGAIIAAELGRAPPDLARLRELVTAQRLGRKSGAGFYTWRDGKAVKPSSSGPVPEDLTDRLILALVNECVACLREQVTADADLIDAAVIFGTGFAPFRGGPLAYARSRGAAEIVRRLEELAARHGARFAPDPGWSQLA